MKQTVLFQVMEQPVLTVYNYLDVIGSYCYTYDRDRVCYTATFTLKYNLDTLYFILRNFNVNYMYLSCVQVG